MHRFSACIAVGAMLFALVSAPLFHIHERDDHHAESFVHAHFPTQEDVSHSEREIEPPHSHGHGRSVDIFAVNTPASAPYQVVAEVSGPFSPVAPVVSRAVLSVQVLRAHTPPERSNLPSRSPPLF